MKTTAGVPPRVAALELIESIEARLLAIEETLLGPLGRQPPVPLPKGALEALLSVEKALAELQGMLPAEGPADG